MCTLCLSSSVVAAFLLLGCSRFPTQQVGCTQRLTGFCCFSCALPFSAVRHGVGVSQVCTNGVTCGAVLSAVVHDIANAIIQLVRQVPGWHAPVQACWCVLSMAPAAFTQSPQASIVISLVLFVGFLSLLATANQQPCVRQCLCVCVCLRLQPCRTLVPEPFVWQPGFWGCSCGLDLALTAATPLS